MLVLHKILQTIGSKNSSPDLRYGEFSSTSQGENSCHESRPMRARELLQMGHERSESRSGSPRDPALWLGAVGALEVG